MPVEGETLVEVFLNRTSATPERPALRSKDGQSWTSIDYASFRRSVFGVANGLISLGVSPGTRVGILSSNRPEWLFCDFAVMLTGAVTVPVYPTNSPDQVAHVAGHSACDVLFVEDDSQYEKVQKVRERLPGVRQVILITGPEADGAMPLERLAAAGAEYAAAHAGELEERAGSVGPGDLASIVYTSGTTGEPKGAMLTHSNFVWTTAAVGRHIELHEGERLISYLPLSHIFERLVSCAIGVTYGFDIWFAESTAALLDNLKQCRPTIFVGVPRVYEKFYSGMKNKIASHPKKSLIEKALSASVAGLEARQSGRRVGGFAALKSAVLDRLVLSKLREGIGMDKVRFAITGAAPIDPEIARFIQAIGIDLLDGYGQTETTAPVSLNPIGAARIGTVGPPLPGVELAFDADGEILVKGGNLFAGYYNNQAATQEVITDAGFLRTGDIGLLDEAGYLRITDRKKDLFKTAGGKYVAPQAIENKLTLQPLIAQAVVIGDRRPFPTALLALDDEALAQWAAARGLSEVPPADGEEVGPAVDEAVGRVNASLSQPEQIKKWAVLPDLLTQESGEVTPTMKVRRGKVMEKYSDLIEQMYAR